MELSGQKEPIASKGHESLDASQLVRWCMGIKVCTSTASGIRSTVRPVRPCVQRSGRGAAQSQLHYFLQVLLFSCRHRQALTAAGTLTTAPEIGNPVKLVLRQANNAKKRRCNLRLENMIDVTLRKEIPLRKIGSAFLCVLSS